MSDHVRSDPLPIAADRSSRVCFAIIAINDAQGFQRSLDKSDAGTANTCGVPRDTCSVFGGKMLFIERGQIMTNQGHLG